jgi:sugar phosphate isomerase/epimerase
VDFPKVLASLREVKFTGPFAVEIELSGHGHGDEAPIEAVTNALARSYRYLNGLGLS